MKIPLIGLLLVLSFLMLFSEKAGGQDVCAGSTVNYSAVPEDEGNSLQWIIEPGEAGVDWNIDAENSPETDIEWITPGIFTLTITETDGEGNENVIDPYPLTITVNSLSPASISYDNSPYCAAGIATVTISGTGTYSGSFSSEAPLAIDPSSGDIDLASSIPDTYVIFYNYSDGICTAETTTSVTINAVPEAVIEYPGSPYCTSGTATVSISGTTGGTFSSTSGLSINGITGIIDLAASSPGDYTITYNFFNGTCSNSTATEVTISMPPTATISYPGSPYCKSGTADVVQNGEPGGTYSSETGLIIDLTTGTIDLDASTPGNYTVTYSFSDGLCSNETTASVTINDLPVATISYPEIAPCSTGTVSVTLEGDYPGGAYTSTEGLSLDAATGEIDLDTSTPGTYSVTYSYSDGTCSNTATTSVTLNASQIPTPVFTCSDPDNTFYAGATITFTAGGGTLYDFMVDGASVQSGTADTYTSNTLTDGKVVSVNVTNEAGCNATSAGITVHVITLPLDWVINPASFTYNGKVTAKVFIDYTAVGSGFLGAFADAECRGIVESKYVPASDHYVFELICYSNSDPGESLTFKYYDPAKVKTYSMNRTIVFAADMEVGDPNTPLEMYNTVNFSKSFTTGWNWFSVNTILANMTLGSVLSAVNTNGDYIKSQVSSATYYPGYGWFGGLTAIDPTKLYKIRVQNNCTVNFTGLPVNVNSSSINLVAGWNWIGYISQSVLTVNDALSSLTKAELDYIKNQTKSATYYNGYGWFGSLANLSPGEGYMMRLTNPGTLNYPYISGKGGVGISMEPPDITFNPADFEFNGSITASVYVDGVVAGSENDILIAYVNDQIRGVTSSQYFSPLGIYLFPIMVHSNQSEGETIEFKYYDAGNDKLYSCDETIVFRSEMVIADAFNSFVLNVNSLQTSINRQENIEVLQIKTYPNPFNGYLNIEYEITEETHVILEIFDIYGTTIRQLVNQVQQPDRYSVPWDSQIQSDGTYIIKLQAGDRQKIQKVTLIK